MSCNSVKLKKKDIAASPWLLKKNSVFSFKMLFAQILLKANKRLSSLPISAAGGYNDREDFAAVQLIHFCMVAAVSVQSTGHSAMDWLRKKFQSLI